MGAGWVGLLVAIVGVAGTLGAALLTQNRADRTKRMELQAAAEQRREERDHARELLRAEQAEARLREGLERRRACYITLNTAARQYVTAMTNHVHAVRRGEDTAGSLTRLEECRLAFRDSYAEAQMVAPDTVLRACSTAKTRLNTAYGSLRDLCTAPSAHAEELAALEAGFHQEVWPYLGAMKRSMRADLGIDD
ncbi:hypothetical protein E2C00_29145 [Streptomyces sp. WAC05374]|uniref:hypothetical protein n=1 Tax=Streptomyces sp. WAC05374 TaxID=2487420 RepID=UPI000F897F1C|nr:hypothetical protein [Streptomyces sp. WAC05374]RST18622.1 hypothetical protein EF905_04575 [Streptomyces sp. WAC05374]TDF40690.1 hypothetical protein E2B92_23940 [Streptomyces sp. WAC05374]TDF49401.1 hypothetical protein E2C00_29145 [Streptomyces sp. WAC05374]TDF49906.1 hypothetical protein E2C02_25555 [Streptomyces sp. WAC05374]